MRIDSAKARYAELMSLGLVFAVKWISEWSLRTRAAESAEASTEKARMLMFLCCTEWCFAPEALAALTIAYSNLL